MDKLLKKFFDDIISYEKDFVKMDAIINREIEKHTAEYQKKMSIEEIEELKNLLFEITRISEREGFFLGLRYAVRIFFTGIFS